MSSATPFGYTCDANNRLILRSHDADGYYGTIGDTTRTLYVQEMGQIELELEKVGSWADFEAEDLTHRYLWGPGANNLLVDEAVSDLFDAEENDTLYALPDHLGTVRDLVSYDPIAEETVLRKHTSFDSFGQVVDEAYYDKSGDPIASSHAEAVDQLFMYTGAMRDGDTELQNHWNRWYDPETGSWISVDPIKDGVNWYGYVGNRVTAFVDPSGLEFDFAALTQQYDEWYLTQQWENRHFSSIQLVRPLDEPAPYNSSQSWSDFHKYRQRAAEERARYAIQNAPGQHMYAEGFMPGLSPAERKKLEDAMRCRDLMAKSTLTPDERSWIYHYQLEQAWANPYTRFELTMGAMAAFAGGYTGRGRGPLNVPRPPAIAAPPPAVATGPVRPGGAQPSILANGVVGTRPSPRQSELDVLALNPNHRPQMSFNNGRVVPYGSRGSVRPEGYRVGEALEVKNYNLLDAHRRANLYNTIQCQYIQRLSNLPRGTHQRIVIDIRGQEVTEAMMMRVRNNILTITGTPNVTVEFLR